VTTKTAAPPDTVRPKRRGLAGPRADNVGWRQEVRTGTKAIRARIGCVAGHDGGRLDSCAHPEVCGLLDAADTAVRQRYGGLGAAKDLRDWWDGATFMFAFGCLHEAEALAVETEHLAVLKARLPARIGAARTVLTADDPRLVRAERLAARLRVAGAEPVDPAQRNHRLPVGVPVADPRRLTENRYVVAELVRGTRRVSDERYARSRNFRNQLMLTVLSALGGLVVLLVAAGLGVEVAVCSPDPPSCPVVADAAGPGVQALLAVLLFGAIGALVSAVRPLSRIGGSWNRFKLPTWQAAVKIAVGPLTAVLGLLAANSGVAGIDPPPNAATVLLLAAVFGAGQQAVTRHLDRQADELLAATPSRREREQLPSLADGKDGPEG
jgi:hypothetical protein